jgi:hypothetical protein
LMNALQLYPRTRGRDVSDSTAHAERTAPVHDFSREDCPPPGRSSFFRS